MSTRVCPLCQSENVFVFLDGREETLSGSAVGSSRTELSPGRILRCRSCRLGFRQVRPAEDALSDLYSDLDTTRYEAEYRGRARTAARHLNIVHQFRRAGRLLDVGCASGLFLRRAADAGWQVVGAEPARALYEKAKEALAGRGEVLRGTLQEVSLPPASFDVVTLWDVLEHVPDPRQFVSACAKLLRPGGLLFLNVPDLDSLQARLLGSRWPVFLPEHLNYFNRESLRLCAEAAGLKCLQFGRRLASFSVEYVLYRLAQHHIPGAAGCHRLARRSFVGRVLISVPLGELWSALRNESQEKDCRGDS